MDTVVEVFAEFAGARHLFQRLIGGADEPEIDLAALPPTQPLHLPVFEHAQQLGLQRQGQGGNLIQKKGAGVGQLNLPWLATRWPR